MPLHDQSIRRDMTGEEERIMGRWYRKLRRIAVEAWCWFAVPPFVTFMDTYGTWVAVDIRMGRRYVRAITAKEADRIQAEKVNARLTRAQ